MVSLARAGLPLIIVSNQRGVARGLVSRATLASIEARIRATMGPEGAHVEAFRYCVHDLDEGCECRKPQPGLLRAAARELALDLSRSWMIGDSLSDVQAGHAAGCRCVLIAPAPDPVGPAERTAPSLREAAAIVLADIN
jgi:D-glycero-D-manno-heptose 1,7-bisphosphate phosphatase